MKTLPQTLRKNGFTYIQVRRGRRSCIYKQIRKLKRVVVEARELFPENEVFSKTAWTSSAIEGAMNKFEVPENSGHEYPSFL